MGALLTLPITLLNALLPFTRPGTPILQDLIHTAVLCGTLYYAPQLADWYHNQHNQGETAGPTENEAAHQPGTEPGTEYIAEDENLPLDDRLVLQDDEEDAGPPPLAPTPPHIAQNVEQPPLPQAQPRVDDFPEAGPANPQGPRVTSANRTVGAKKAKSLARKDQRRAYHEFHRQEAELRRLQEAEGAEEREAALAAERERRAKITEEIVRKEKEERETRKREQEKEVADENERRERCVGSVREEIERKGAVDLVEEAWKEGKDRLWIERLVRASGLLQQLQAENERIMITGDGWLVKIDAEIMANAYAEAEALGSRNSGRVSFDDLGGLMEKAILARAKA